MTAIWKLSYDKFDRAERFPLPIINIVSKSIQNTSSIVCVNQGLRALSILEASTMWARIESSPDSLVEFCLYYVNPVSGNIIGYYLDMPGSSWIEAIQQAAYDFALSSLPTIKIETNSQLQPFDT